MRWRIVVGLVVLLCASTAWAQTYETATVLKWETKLHAYADGSTGSQTVYSVRVGDHTYEVGRLNNKIEMTVGQQLKCRVDKKSLFVVNDKGKEKKYAIVGTE